MQEELQRKNSNYVSATELFPTEPQGSSTPTQVPTKLDSTDVVTASSVEQSVNDKPVGPKVKPKKKAKKKKAKAARPPNVFGDLKSLLGSDAKKKKTTPRSLRV